MAWQHGLCAYCETRVDAEECQIEHVVPRKLLKVEGRDELDIANLVVCCLGGSEPDREETAPLDERPGRELTCGQAKRDAEPADFVDPRELPAAPSLVLADPSGTIRVDRNACRAIGRDPEGMAGTLALLQLNARRLRLERRRRWRDLLAVVPGDADGTTLGEWARAELLPRSDGLLPEFFTTGRSFFGVVGEQVLAEPPQDWI